MKERPDPRADLTMRIKELDDEASRCQRMIAGKHAEIARLADRAATAIEAREEYERALRTITAALNVSPDMPKPKQQIKVLGTPSGQ